MSPNTCTPRRDSLEIRDIRGSLVMCMITSMLDDVRKDLLSNLTACFDEEPSNLRVMDSGVPGERYFFEALHFAYYNRHCTRVGLLNTL